MLEALQAADWTSWTSILLKAFAYGAALLAAGGAFALIGLPGLARTEQRRIGLTTGAAALLAALLACLRIPLRSSFLMGGDLAGALDPTLLTMVAESPLGDATALRVAGCGLALTAMARTEAARWIAGIGALMICASFALRGHALNEPRLLLGGLITAHIACLAFWLGALAPLYRTAGGGDLKGAAALAHVFSSIAIWIVLALAAAGALLLLFLGAAAPMVVHTPYGQGFAVKLALFATVMVLAAANKYSLTPALTRGEARAGRRLRWSIRLEALLIAAILLITAAITTLSAPPGAGHAG